MHSHCWKEDNSKFIHKKHRLHLQQSGAQDLVHEAQRGAALGGRGDRRGAQLLDTCRQQVVATCRRQRVVCPARLPCRVEPAPQNLQALPVFPA